jgi:hypothetical protein
MAGHVPFTYLFKYRINTERVSAFKPDISRMAYKGLKVQSIISFQHICRNQNNIKIKIKIMMDVPVFMPLVRIR